MGALEPEPRPRNPALKSSSMLTLPNLFSFARIVLIVPFILLLERKEYDYAFWVYVVAAVTNALDGAAARLLHQRSTLGTYLDPAADKLFMTAAFLALGVLGVLPLWLVGLVILRDVVIVVGLLILRLSSRRPEIRPSLISKGTTLFQLLMIGAAVEFQAGNWFRESLVVLTAAGTVISGLQYIAKGIKILRTG